MAYINISGQSSQATLQISTSSIASTTTGVIVAALQDITVGNAVGIFNWTQLDTFSQKAVPTPASNSVSGNLVVDDTQFFASGTGLFDLSNNATLIYFRVYFNGRGSGAKYVSGQGYLTNLAPSVSPTAPIWVTPFTINVDGNLTSSSV